METFVRIAIISVCASALGGCQQYLARQDLIESYTGNAVAHNRAIQMIDPWPRYAYDTHIPTNGRRQANAYTNYAKQGEDDEVAPLAPVQLVVPQ